MKTLGHFCLLLAPLALWAAEPETEQATPSEPPPAPELAECEAPVVLPPELPFTVGERLVYRLSWAGFTVGRAEMLVSGPVLVDETPCLKFTLSVRTSGIAEKLYKVRTTIDGWVDVEMQQTRYYRKAQLEGKTHRDIEVRMSEADGLAFYFNFGRMDPPCDLEGGAFDPLSAIFRFRTFELKEGREYAIPVTDGKKRIEGSVRVAAKERCETPAGTFWAYRVEPSLEGVGGVFQKSDDARLDIWLSADAMKIPVLMESEVVVGSFQAQLESVEIGEVVGVPAGMAVAEEKPGNAFTNRARGRK